jgi:multiple sugar transport system substrate-binding protein
MTYRGLTWDHPRGFNALDRAGRESGLVSWDKQALEGFESAPITDLCAAYDLVVLDHPHLGEAIAQGCLRPLGDVFKQTGLDRISRDSIGPSFRSYVMSGKSWALPLDAASQVMAVRPEAADAELSAWDEVTDFAAHEGGVVLSLAGPHAMLSLMSVAASLDEGMDLADGGWLANDLAVQAYEILAEIYGNASHVTDTLNPIGILEHMSANTDVRVCPLIFGYVPYAARPEPATVLFRNAPHARDGGRPGSILGGTGIGISVRCKPSPHLIDHLLYLMSEAAQSGFLPQNDGQPSNRAAWADTSVNAPVNDFYRATVATLEAAAVRPRHLGYINFQASASNLLRQSLATRASARPVAQQLQEMFTASLPAAAKVPV